MNQPASFCVYPCDDPFAQAVANDFPPPRTTPPPNPTVPIFPNGNAEHEKRETPSNAGNDLLNPPYAINNNTEGVLSDRTAYVVPSTPTYNSPHNGTVPSQLVYHLETDNLHGTMMSVATHEAMLARRPGLRTLVITRSTFAGAGHKVGKWLGDNLSTWEHYRISIAGMLSMATLFQVPMVGSDICGFGDNMTVALCAGWAMLGAFYPFRRNAAENTLEIRYRLLDYFYTAFRKASVDGSPVLNPLWFKYPTGTSTFGINLQYFFGDSILVLPVAEVNATTVMIYLPRDKFYEFATLMPVEGTGHHLTLTDVNFTTITLHIRGGAVLPLRASGAITTTELRSTDFEFVVAPGADGRAAGALYVDDGVSIVQDRTTSVEMAFAEGKLCVYGSFGFEVGVKVASVVFLGVSRAPAVVTVSHVPDHTGEGEREEKVPFEYDGACEVLRVHIDTPLTHDFEVVLHY